MESKEQRKFEREKKPISTRRNTVKLEVSKMGKEQKSLFGTKQLKRFEEHSGKYSKEELCKHIRERLVV
jgi:hypothetical protein